MQTIPYTVSQDYGGSPFQTRFYFMRNLSREIRNMNRILARSTLPKRFNHLCQEHLKKEQKAGYMYVQPAGPQYLCGTHEKL